ncbi:MAG: phage tail assembly chaperone [Sphingomonas sp.]
MKAVDRSSPGRGGGARQRDGRVSTAASGDTPPPLRGPPPLSGEDFGSRAGRLAGFAGAALGWRPGEFWAATPAELGAVVRALVGDEAAVLPPDAGVIARLREAFPDG